MSTLPNWNEVKFDWSDAKYVPAILYPSTWIGVKNVEKVCACVENFNVGRSTPGDILDSLNNYNMGNVEKPGRYTVDITTIPYESGYKLLNSCSLGRKYFDIVLAPAYHFTTYDAGDSVGLPADEDWVFRSVFVGCKVRNLSEKYAMGTKPTVTFSCTALRYVFQTDAAGTSVTLGNGFKDMSLTDGDLKIPST